MEIIHLDHLINCWCITVTGPHQHASVINDRTITIAASKMLHATDAIVIYYATLTLLRFIYSSSM